ncbi:Protein of unknown function [Allochromatium warmingii]|uniref:DUF2868 domain-containing protein n=1 Tax=Allochromatium warmingii TaxID=61595 RepID=A0A1H3BZI0_ALLWA|nr:DUF2868 domain-containing protein [Allochromatium warmingii]SDX47323.1 Protein of unknown function [Allochromatium warmingii]
MDPRHATDDLRPAAGAPAQVADWTAADLIDLEYYLDADEQALRERPAARKALAERDRTLYLERIESALGTAAPHSPAHRRLSLRLWLKARRADEDPTLKPLLPGAAFAQAQRLSLWLMALLGLLVGISLSATLLDYDGHLPISVPWFVFLLVVMQFALSVGVIVTWLRRAMRQRQAGVEESWLLSQVIQPALERIAHWLQEQHLARSPQELRERALATRGLMRAQFSVYGPLSILALLIPLQVFGVAFNLGVILTTITLEWFTDIAFGWGTSLAAHPQTIYDLVRLIAAPWSWLFGEGAGYPTLAQIEGSRVYLEQWAVIGTGFKPNPEHLRSWRWFLVLAVFTYGLLPRLALLVASLIAQRLTLKHLTFTHGRLQALYVRLLTPHLDTHVGETGQGPEMHIPVEIAPGKAPQKRDAVPPVSHRPWRDELANRGKPVAVAAPVVTVTPSVEPNVVEPPPEVQEQEQEVISSDEAPASSPTAVEIEPEVQSEPEPEPPLVVTMPELRDQIITSSEEQEVISSDEALASSPTAVEIEPEVQSEPEPEPPREITQPELCDQIAAQAIIADDEALASSVSAVEIEPAPKLEPEPESEPEPPLEIAQPELCDQIEIQAIIADDEAPALSASAVEIEPEPAPAPEPAPLPTRSDNATEYRPDTCLLLLHVDIDDVLEPEDRPRLADLLRTLSGWNIGAQATFGAGSQMTARALALIEAGHWHAPPARLAVIQDGSQPPITENLVFLRQLRAAAGTQAPILLALVGDPDDDDRLPPLRAFDYRDWQTKIDQMADPYLRLEMLTPPTANGEDD